MYCNILYVAMHPVVALIASYGVVAIVAYALGRRAVERCEAEQHMRRVGCRCAYHHIEESLSTGRVHDGREGDVVILSALVGLVLPGHSTVL